MQCSYENGKIAAVGETEELVKEVEGKVWNVVLDMAEVMTYETKIPVVNIYNREDGKTVLRYLAERPVIPDRNRQMQEWKICICGCFRNRKEEVR